MKTSIWHLPLTLLAAFGMACTPSTRAYGQAPPTGQSGSGVQSTPAACDNPPCVMESHGPGLNTGQKHAMPAPLTPEQQERKDQEKRYTRLFASLEADENLAQRLDAAGDTVNAASWRADFARKSGLTPEEAEIVKKIGAQYRRDQVTLNASCHADLLAARHTYGAQAGPKFLDVPSCQQLWNLTTKAVGDIISVLGSRSYSRLDGYTRHMLDNARILYRQGQPSSGQTQIPSTATDTTEKPQ